MHMDFRSSVPWPSTRLVQQVKRGVGDGWQLGTRSFLAWGPDCPKETILSHSRLSSPLLSRAFPSTKLSSPPPAHPASPLVR